MVRLEVSAPSALPFFGSEVSIPIWCDWKQLQLHSRQKRLQCFNSYMVRLEDAVPESNQLVRFKFQFLYGAIGRIQQSALVRRTQSFNSYMVRLEVRRGILYKILKQFQFLYGAIGSFRT